MEQQLHDASSQQQALAASCKQLEQQRDRLNDQLQKEQKEKQDAHAQLQEQRASFEEEIASLHTLAGRHKEERASLENDRQTLGGLVQELTRKAEVSCHKSSCYTFGLCCALMTVSCFHNCCFLQLAKT